MLDYQLYKYNTYKDIKLNPAEALYIKSLLNARRYYTYENSPTLCYQLMINGLEENKVFKKDNREMKITQRRIGHQFEEIGIDGIKNCRRIIGNNFCNTIISEKGICVIKVNISRDSNYLIQMSFFDMQSVDYLKELSKEKFDKLKVDVPKDENGNLARESIYSLLLNYDYSKVEKYIIPDFSKIYYSGANIPSTEPELTSVLENCYKDVETLLEVKKSRFDFKKVLSRRHKYDSGK